MIFRASYPRLVSLFVFLFVTLQTSALAHAAQYGDDHTHDGVVCEVEAIASEQDAITPPVPVIDTIFVADTDAVYETAFVSAAVTPPPGRAPPPRSPPTSHA